MNALSSLIATMLVVSTSLSYAGAKFTGSAKFQFGAQNKTVTFGCGGVTNSSKDNATGTLMVKLWAMDAPYQGGTLTGRLLGSYKLDGLDQGASYGTVSKTVTATLPPVRKAYYICLALTEYQNGGYVLVDSRNFDGTSLLGPLQMLTLTGPSHWQTDIAGGTVSIEVAKISHNRNGDTGSLKLAVWATASPYKGGAIHGFELGSVKKPALKQGFTYNDVKNTAKYTPPPPGWYFVSILLLEFDGGDYKIMSYLPGTKATLFK